MKTLDLGLGEESNRMDTLSLVEPESIDKKTKQVPEDPEDQVSREDSDILEEETFSITDDDPSHIVTCSRCGDRIKREKALIIEGKTYCFPCAKKLFQKFEQSLQSVKVISRVRDYCVFCNEEIPEKIPKLWKGEVMVGDVVLHPAMPVCADCGSKLAAYMVDYFEQRGWLVAPIKGKERYEPTNPAIYGKNATEIRRNIRKRMLAFWDDINLTVQGSERLKDLVAQQKDVLGYEMKRLHKEEADRKKKEAEKQEEDEHLGKL